MIQSQGSVIRASLSDEPTPENVQREWHKITDMSQAKHMKTGTDFMKTLMDQLEYLGADKNNNRKVVSDTFSFGSKDLILYALGSESSHHIVKIDVSLIDVIFQLEQRLRTHWI